MCSLRILYIFLGFTFLIHCTDYQGQTHMSEEDQFTLLRQEMVKNQIVNRGIVNPEVVRAMLTVKRHKFVLSEYIHQAYNDGPLPIGEGQTISQPYIVAYMTEILELKPDHKILEIGTGSGYQAAVLAEISPHVYTIDIVKNLLERAKKVLKEEGYTTVRVRYGNGYEGWPEEAPFDAIIVTCAPDNIPESLVSQLKNNGRLIIPIGGEYSVQQLVLVEKEDGKIKKKDVLPVRFVPMVE